MTVTNEIETLIATLAELKANENAAKAARIQAEENILTAIGALENDKTMTVRTPNYKVTIKPVVNYKLDNTVTIPDDILNCFVRIKKEINVTELKKLKANQPAIYRIAENAIITSAGKTSVLIEQLTENQDE